MTFVCHIQLIHSCALDICRIMHDVNVANTWLEFCSSSRKTQRPATPAPVREPRLRAVPALQPPLQQGGRRAPHPKVRQLPVQQAQAQRQEAVTTPSTTANYRSTPGCCTSNSSSPVIGYRLLSGESCDCHWLKKPFWATTNYWLHFKLTAFSDWLLSTRCDRFVLSLAISNRPLFKLGVEFWSQRCPI